jgi:hypothetical protein
LKLQVWDIGDQGIFKSLIPNYCRGAKAAFILYDITDSQEFEKLPEWIHIVRENAGTIPIILIGYELELEELRHASTEDVNSLIERYSIEAYEEISTHTNQNVKEIFELMANILIERYNPEEIRKSVLKNRFEFKVNEYLTLKLQNNRINIYVKGKLFDQCKYLLLNIPNQEIENYDEIGSIDEAAEILDKSMEGYGHYNVNIPKETEFWGHCSNIQTWYENGYDTRLLHRNIAFPLLKALVEAGDRLAIKVFKEEIAMRLESGYPSVVRYLFNQGYLKYLSEEELKIIIENPKFIQNIFQCTNDVRDILQWMWKWKLLNMINDSKKVKSYFKIIKGDYHEIPIPE